MKAKITLTDQQIDMLVAQEEEQLRKQYEQAVLKLREKYRNYTITIGDDTDDTTEKKKRVKLDINEILALRDSGLTVSDIAKKLGSTYASVFQKLNKEGKAKASKKK